jgi:pseudouridine kinase
MVVRDASQVTSEYAAFVDESGNLVAGMSDMHAIDKLAPSDLEELWPLLSGAQWLFVDCNVSADVLRWCIARAQRSSVRLAIDAVSDAKARKLPAELHGVDLLVLNESEARSYGCDDAAQLRERGAAAVVLTMGDRGAIAADQTTTPIPATAASCIDVTGAGDAFVAATLFRLLQGDSLAEAARVGSLAAALTVESKNTVRADLSTKLLEDAWTSP